MRRQAMSGVVGVVLLMTGVVMEGRPLSVDDADTVGPNQCEVEAGIGYVHDDDCKHWDFPVGLTYGLVPHVDIGFGFGGQFEERMELAENGDGDDCVREHGLGDLVVGAKVQVVSRCPLGARHALAGLVKFPTADDDNGLGSGETDYDLMWMASHSIGEKSGVHLNLGYSWIGGSDDDVLHYGVALDYQIMDTVQWVGEVFAEAEIAGGAETVVLYNTGFRWSPAESLTLDIAGGSTISGDGPVISGTVGLTWAFGL